MDEDTSEELRTRTLAEPTAPGPERRIGPYRLIREIGHGGMGTVYLAARADEQYQKRVAIKVIKAGMDNQEVVHRFRRERQILASLDHPHIARLLDGGATDEGLPYFVMEYIEGQPIHEYCDSHTLSIAERLKLFRGVCAAVQYAHRNLIVHRDIKPSNVIVTSEGVPRLLDFGIAKLMNPELSGEGVGTTTGLVMTPEYASPEQVRGGPITTATDVYSLGVVLYELLTGRMPYRLKTRKPLEVLKAVIEEEPEWPSTAVSRTEEMADRTTITAESVSRTREGTPERLRKRLAGDLDNIVMTALRKEPQRRYGSVEALSEDIRRYLEGRPVAARKATLGYRARKFVGRNRLAVVSSAAVLLLFVGFGISMAIQSRRVARERDRAARERDRAERVSAFLVDLFKISDPSEARGNTVTAREMLDKGAAKIEQELKDQPDVRATLMDTVGNVYVGLGLYGRARPLLEDALATRRRILGPQHPDVAVSLHDLSVALWRAGDYGASEAAARETLDMRRRLLGGERPEVAEALDNLATVVYLRQRDPEAEALYKEALALRLRLLGPRHVDTARSQQRLANVLSRRGQHAEAASLYRQALETRRALLGPEHRLVADTLISLALDLSISGEPEAERDAREALAIYRRVLGNEHPEVAHGLGLLAEIQFGSNDLTGAEASARAALRLHQLRNDDGPDHARVLALLGEILAERGRVAEAEPLLKQALDRYRQLWPDSSETAQLTEDLGTCLSGLRRHSEAEPLLLGSYPVLKATFGDQSKETRDALEHIVKLYEAWGKPEKAAEYRAMLAKSADRKSPSQP